MLSPKVLIEDTTFTSPTGEGTAILRGQSSLLRRLWSKVVPSFLSYFEKAGWETWRFEHHTGE